MDLTKPAAGFVKALRTLAGMSQRELARASDVAASAIARIEAGAMDPSLETVSKLAAAAVLGGRVVKSMTTEQLWGASAKLIPDPVMRTMCEEGTRAGGVRRPGTPDVRPDLYLPAWGA